MRIRQHGPRPLLRHALFLLAFVTGTSHLGLAQAVESPKTQTVQRFDPKRNSNADIAQAIADAKNSGKRILLDFGGDWCPYCHELDAFFEQNADLLQLRDDRFIVVPVYYDSEHKQEFLQLRFSKLLGIPHFFVLDSDGTLLHSQHVFDLRKDGSYNAEYMKSFLEKWSKPAPTKSH